MEKKNWRISENQAAKAGVFPGAEKFIAVAVAKHAPGQDSSSTAKMKFV